MKSLLNKKEETLKEKLLFAESLFEIKKNAEKFLEYIAKNEDRAEVLHMEFMISAVGLFEFYTGECLTDDESAIIFPYEYSPFCLLMNYFSRTDNLKDIVKGINEFIDRCKEFIAPITEAITETEILAVLELVQNKFKLLDLISPGRPLRIHRLDNSHIEFNSECGSTVDEDGAESQIYLYSPREVELCDRVFIFAHELGHALHLALTKDIDKVPPEFDEFNKLLGVTVPEYGKAEVFADTFALALFYNTKLDKHVPPKFNKDFLPLFDEFFSIMIKGALKRRGK